MGSILTQTLRPSLSSGLARLQSKSRIPHLWRDMWGAFDPSLAVTGAVLKDFSGNGNDFALSGIVAPGDWPPDIKGHAVEFNGTDEYGSASVDFGAMAKILTISWWMKWAYNDLSEITLELSTNFNNVDGAFFIIPNSSSGDFRVSIQDSVGSAKYLTVDATRPTSDEWHHYSVVLDNSTTAGNIKIYFDGLRQSVSIATNDKDQSTVFPADTLYLYSRAGTSLFGFGRLGPLYIHTRELAASEVMELVVNPHAPFMQRSTPQVTIATPAGGDRLVSFPSGDPLFSDPSGDPLRSSRVDPVAGFGTLVGSAQLSGFGKLKSSSAGDGSLVASAASLFGVAVRTGAVTGVLVSSSPTLTNSIITKGTGTLSTLQSTLFGQGRKVAKASGTLVAISEISGTSIKLSPSQGALLALSPRLAGLVSLNRLRVGTGVLEAQSLLEGFAQKVEPVVEVADGILVASSSLLSGVGKKFELKVGDGILSTPAPTLSARAKKAISGGGIITASSPTLSGPSILVGKSSGAFESATGVLSGVAIKRAAASGSLLASALLSGNVGQIKPIVSDGTLLASSPAIQSLCSKLGSAGGQLQGQAALSGIVKKISTGAIGNLVTSASALYGGARNASTGEKQAYRVESIQHIPGNPTKKVMLEPIRRPLV